MWLEVCLLFLVIWLCLKSTNKQILCMMFLFLPIHGTIKNIVFSNGGELFAVWKELCIVIMFIRTFSQKIYCFNKIFAVYILMGIFVSVYIFIGYNLGYPIFSMIKTVYFPCVLTLVVAKMRFNYVDLRGFLLAVFVGSLFINLTGILDFMFPVIRMLFRILMGTEYVVDANGNAYYEINSYKIMGYDRACGLMAGGPNQFGVFNSGILFLCIISLLYLKKYFNNKWRMLVLNVTTCVSAFCLLISFSRAGMAILLIALVIMGIFEKRIRVKVIGCIFVVVFMCVCAVFISSQISDIILGTLTGEEASSSARYSMTENSWSFLITHPFGHGFGATSSLGKRIYFAESTFINMGIEFGIIGVSLIIMLLAVIYNNITKNIPYNILARSISSFLIAYMISCVVSFNPFENPFVYYAWGIFVLGLMRETNWYVSK